MSLPQTKLIVQEKITGIKKLRFLQLAPASIQAF
jgi:hypothetical protein